MSLEGGLTDRRDESGVGALGIDSAPLAPVLMCGCMCLFFYNTEERSGGDDTATR